MTATPSREESLKKSLHSAAHKVRQTYPDCWKTREIDYSLDDAAKPGKTLLWDLIQHHTPATVNAVALFTAERELISLILSMNHTRLAYRFSEACHENVKQHRAVAVSLRILPKLMQGFQCSTTTEFVNRTAADFFADLVHFSDSVLENEQQKANEIRVRLSFLQVWMSSVLYNGFLHLIDW